MASRLTGRFSGERAEGKFYFQMDENATEREKPEKRIAELEKQLLEYAKKIAEHKSGG